ncbi:MAG: aminoacyl--tRNA ligase-related protein [bacterium]|nr:aminoacyl--tRNA ligase-related protein [bacterium]
MLQSHLFTKTLKTAPKDEVTQNAQLLVRAGYVDKLMAGAYSYLPLGLRVLRNIERIVREEMDAIGGQEILMPVLHPKSIWQQTGGWDKIDILFKIKSRTEKEYALGQSEEEVVSPLVMKFIQSYKDLPKAVYQIHWKYRDELRSKSGLLRGVEFLMKDMYSFHETQEDFEKYYAIVKQAYFRVFERLGLVAKATEASGGAFTEKISYEFMVLTDAGEDNILYCDACEFCVNVEISKEKAGDTCSRCSRGTLTAVKASEVGNIFDLGQKYGKDFDLSFLGKDGKKYFATMGCYGIGISRLMGVIAEKCNDDRGIIWPESVAPFAVHILALNGKDEEQNRDIQANVTTLTSALQQKGIEFLLDDREGLSAGEKFADSDLLGIPKRIVISEKSLAQGGVELKNRTEKDSRILSVEEIIASHS